MPRRYVSTDPDYGAPAPSSSGRRYVSMDPNFGAANEPAYGREAAADLARSGGSAVAGGAGALWQIAKGLGSMGAYGLRAASAPLRVAGETIYDTVTGGDPTAATREEVEALIRDNPGLAMAKGYVQGLEERGTAAVEAAERGDTREAIYQGTQGVLALAPGYHPVSKVGERAVGKGDGQASVLEADPAAAGELGAQLIVAAGPARSAKAVESVTGIPTARAATATAEVAADTSRKMSEWLARSAVKPLVSSMKRVAGASQTGVDVQAQRLIRTIIDERIATPDQVARLLDGTEKELQGILSASNAPTDAAVRAQRYIGALRRRALKAGLAEDQVATFESKMGELLRSELGEDVVHTVSRPGTVLDEAGRPFMTEVEETTRKLRDEVPATEALERARETSRAQTRRGWGEQKGAEMEATKAYERGLRDSVKAAVPEAKPILQRQGRLIQAREALDRMAFREANREPAGLAGQIVAGTEVATGKLPVMGFAMEVLRSGKLRGSFQLDKLANQLEAAVAANKPAQAAFILGKLGVTVTPSMMRPAPPPRAALPFPKAADDDDQRARFAADLQRRP
jgi:hypothetical protein